VVFAAEFPPSGIAARHFHPGDESIYMLQGSLMSEPDHGQAFELKAGQIVFNPAKHIHKSPQPERHRKREGPQLYVG
jgi:quercetin dioxygenase-like cupin family protein